MIYAVARAHRRYISVVVASIFPSDLLSLVHRIGIKHGYTALTGQEDSRDYLPICSAYSTNGERAAARACIIYLNVIYYLAVQNFIYFCQYGGTAQILNTVQVCGELL
jgi:hypothetical protein